MSITIEGSEGITFPDGKQQIGGSIDGLIEGTTYKRILAAVATALNGGAVASLMYLGAATTADMDTYTTSGVVSFAGETPSAHGPVAGALYGILEIIYETYYKLQKFIASDGRAWFRVRAGGSWGSWMYLWTSGNDGNGGQPPAPKPQITAETQGQWKAVQNGDNVELKSPNVANSTRAYHLILYNTSTGKLENGNFGASIVSGDTSIYPAVVGISSLCFFWRIA